MRCLTVCHCHTYLPLLNYFHVMMLVAPSPKCNVWLKAMPCQGCFGPFLVFVFICETWIEAKRRMNEKIRRRKRKEKRETKRWKKNEEQDDFFWFLVFLKKFQNNKYIFQSFQNLDFFFQRRKYYYLFILF